RAAEELAKGGVFIAVGALHLPTEDGLVELLRADGYEVTRVE
ncbi:MAG: TraB/GumN family protein, partial [Pseudomonadota bacterium]